MPQSYQLGKCVDEIHVGDSASFTKTIHESDVLGFAAITEDHNPIHTDEAYAAKTRFGRRLAHGPLVAGLVAPVLGMKLPGMGTIAVSQTLQYLAPVHIGDRITVTIVARKVVCEKNLVQFDCAWVNQNRVKVIEGTFTVMPPPRKLKAEGK
ncbi:MAG: MaoC family dehydratase [Planctomycetes bacterium]|nr:MaoC family dehydratase [Planctomycetota bacterium]